MSFSRRVAGLWNITKRIGDWSMVPYIRPIDRSLHENDKLLFDTRNIPFHKLQEVRDVHKRNTVIACARFAEVVEDAQGVLYVSPLSKWFRYNQKADILFQYASPSKNTAEVSMWRYISVLISSVITGSEGLEKTEILLLQNMRKSTIISNWMEKEGVNIIPYNMSVIVATEENEKSNDLPIEPMTRMVTESDLSKVLMTCILGGGHELLTCHEGEESSIHKSQREKYPIFTMVNADKSIVRYNENGERVLVINDAFHQSSFIDDVFLLYLNRFSKRFLSAEGVLDNIIKRIQAKIAGYDVDLREILKVYLTTACSVYLAETRNYNVTDQGLGVILSAREEIVDNVAQMKELSEDGIIKIQQGDRFIDAHSYVRVLISLYKMLLLHNKQDTVNHIIEDISPLFSIMFSYKENVYMKAHCSQNMQMMLGHAIYLIRDVILNDEVDLSKELGLPDSYSEVFKELLESFEQENGKSIIELLHESEIQVKTSLKELDECEKTIGDTARVLG